MVQELDQRVKNTLATVIAIADRTRDHAPSLESFFAAFRGRIESLSRAHEALARNRWTGVALLELAEATLAPFRSRDRDRLFLKGPDVSLPMHAVPPLSMAVHELLPNAAKYGALARDTGTVRLSWNTTQKAGWKTVAPKSPHLSNAVSARL